MTSYTITSIIPNHSLIPMGKAALHNPHPHDPNNGYL